MICKNLLAAVMLLATAVLVSCTTTENYDAQLDYWLGRSERELVMGWGVPDKQYQLAGNTKMISYIKNEIVSYPGTVSGCVGAFGSPIGYSGCRGLPPSVTSYFCETTFVLVKGRVSRWGHKGNSCRA